MCGGEGNGGLCMRMGTRTARLYSASRPMKMRTDAIPDNKTVLRGRLRALALFVQPGLPSVGDAAVDTEVTRWPSDVMMKVTAVGEGDTVGMAVPLRWSERSAAEYVLVARPDATILPGVAFTDALKRYDDADGDGVETMKFGSSVVTVDDAVEKNAATSDGDSTGAVALRSG